jgi:hypothetical protein
LKDDRLDVEVRGFLFPKQGTEMADCEDAIGINQGAQLYAVADGATEAFDARSWAIQLAHRWVSERPPAIDTESFRSWVGDQGDVFHSGWKKTDLPWYAEEKSRSGSYAAFVGLGLELNGAPRWRAIALGDSCLVHRRRQSLIRSLPVSRYQDFNSAPLLVPSLHRLQESALSRLVTAEGTIEPGDVFLLLSDAAAAWYLERWEGDDTDREEIDRLLESDQGEERVLELVHRERELGRLKDDDIAILRIATKTVS